MYSRLADLAGAGRRSRAGGGDEPEATRAAPWRIRRALKKCTLPPLPRDPLLWSCVGVVSGTVVTKLNLYRVQLVRLPAGAFDSLTALHTL